MNMKKKFKVEMAKLFVAIAFIIVMITGIIAQVPPTILVTRIVIGGISFTIMGFLLGMVIDNEQEKALVREEKQKLKNQVKEKTKVKQGNTIMDDFSPMEIENLSKIIVETLKD